MKTIYLTLVLLLILIRIDVNAQSTHTIDIRNYGNPASSYQFNHLGFFIDSNAVEYNGCGVLPSVHVAIIDSFNCSPLNNCNRDFGQANIYTDPNGDCITDQNTFYSCRARAENFFIYRSNENLQMQSLAHLLDSTGTGNYIILYTFMPCTFSSMDTSFANVLQRLGSTLVTNLQDNFPYIFFCKKGDANSVVEITGTHLDDSILVSSTFDCATSDIAEFKESRLIDIFPNPATEAFNIDMGKVNEPVSISIYNALGELISEFESGGRIETISTKNFPSGFYFVKVDGESFHTTLKMCVVK